MFRAFVLAVVFAAPTLVLAQQSVADRQRELQSQLDQLESQIAAQQTLLDSAQSAHRTLQSQIDILDAEIKKTELQIQAINVTIQQLNNGISADDNTLSALSAKLAGEKESLAEIMRQTEMLDTYSVIEVVLSTKDVTTFFADLDAFISIQNSLASSFDEIARTSTATEDAKAKLEEKLTEQQELQTEAKLARQQVLVQEKEKQQLLTATKGQEATYQKIISSTQKTAAQVRAELFQLAGGGGQIPLPTAIALAKQAGAATGVRPAFILAILQQETSLGANVGQCFLTNTPNKGDGKNKNTGAPVRNVMKGSRDVDPFISLTGALGFDPFSMPVSCPPGYGYGGAMGPSQFIPSTWVLYQDRISKLAGHYGAPANPWDNRDAFIATALYMADLGAAAQTPSAERTAALKYFAGANYRKSAYAFYGDAVMEFAADFKEQIDILYGA
jgi:membrane-bound lytic murein transglycosylase B